MLDNYPLAFGFVNFAILGWLAVAAAPILIHLWMRNVHRDTPWAAMEFLREAIKRNARKLRLQQWILLTIRTLIILLIVLAAAQPFLSGWHLLGMGPTVHRLLVFDASMSMQYEVDGQTRFARAQDLATEFIDRSASGGLYSLCVMGEAAQGVITTPTSDSNRVRRAIAHLQVSSDTVRLRETLEFIEQHLADVTRENRDIGRHEVILFTDLAKHPWSGTVVDASGSVADSNLGRQLAEIGKLSDVVCVDVGVTEAVNISLSQLAVAGALATTVEPVQVATLLTNHSASPVDEVAVQLLVDGRAVDEQTTALASGEGATLTFEVPFDTAAWHSVTVRTAGDALATDDEAHLALEVPNRLRILCVEGAPRAARYVARALNPSGEPTSPLEPIVVGEGSIAELPLTDFQCIFMCNVTRFTPAEVLLLSNYVDQGGGLVVFLGDRVLPEAYNEARTSQHTLQTHGQTVAKRQPSIESGPERSLLPAVIGAITNVETGGVDPLDYEHPIVAAFRGRERAGLLTTPFSTYFALTPRVEQGAKVALATTGGDPLLVTQAYGKGVVALVATAASLDTVDPATGQPWTLLPAWPSFLPIVRELVTYTSPLTRIHGSLEVGGLMEGQLPANWASPTVAIARPDGRVDTVPVVRSGEDVRWAYQATELPGLYTVASQGDELPLAIRAVNVDGRESDLTRIDIEQLHPAIKLRRDVSPETTGQEIIAGSTPLHRWLLHAVLGLLLVESMAAWWFGKGAA